MARTPRADVDPERSARGRSSRARGNDSERMWANVLRAEGWPDAQRAVRTGFRTPERAVADPGDIAGCPGIIWSLKYLSDDLTHHRALALLTEAAQMRHESGSDALTVLVERRKGRLPHSWWCWVWLEQLTELATGPFSLTAAMPIAEPMPVRLVVSDMLALLHANGYGLSSADQGERVG